MMLIFYGFLWLCFFVLKGCHYQYPVNSRTPSAPVTQNRDTEKKPQEPQKKKKKIKKEIHEGESFIVPIEGGGPGIGSFFKTPMSFYFDLHDRHWNRFDRKKLKKNGGIVEKKAINESIRSTR